MRNYDFSPLSRSSVGFDRLFDLLNDTVRLDDTQNEWPPYDIVRTGEDTYSITLALAGYSPEEISIIANQNLLTVKGEKNGVNSDRDYLHRGIAGRPFEQKFSLADHVQVESAGFENGLLQISLVRRIPDAMKPRQIQINTGKSPGKSR